ncbi:serine/threonine-protein kinase [Nocardia sp. NPDC051030]|uniref:serine/threonine-protein kinase n=1 Tax=Nocardia sp. NPDC051030 TaxID=3155162 RepID=UPI0034162845
MQGAGLVAGAVFAEYRIERELGRGGMGTVYLAGHPRLPRMVALKLLNRDLYADEDVRRRFEREADVAARLDHPNIVSVLDRGADAGQLWISMQYVDGSDAADFAGHPLEPMRAVQIVRQTADALDYAHERGVLHRDVKPANILLTAGRGGDRVLLGDFGIARLRDDRNQLTKTGDLLATLAYAAPEQLSGKPVDHRVDQYALGCTLFTLLTGAVPFTATNPGAMVAAHLTQPVPRASLVVPHLPAAIDAVIARAMAKNPDERFIGCIEFADAAQQALIRQPPITPPYPAAAPLLSAVPVPPPAQPPAQPTIAYQLPPHPLPPSRPSRSGQVSSSWRTVSVLLMVLALVATAGAAGIYWKFFRPHGPNPLPWGAYTSLAYSFAGLIPNDPAGTGWRGAHCSTVATIVVQEGDPVPVRQITCTQPDGVTAWYTEYARPDDLTNYLAAHTVRVEERDVSGGTGGPLPLQLHRPTNPAAPFALATYKDVLLQARTNLVEVSWPGHTFDEVRDQWWQPAPFEQR